MSATIRKDFEQYAGAAVEALRRRAEPSRGPVRLVPHPDRDLREVVVRLEDSKPFGQLVAATRQMFHPKPSRRDESIWRHSIQSFFRRSGFYLGVVEDPAPSLDVLFAQYIGAFESQERRVTYLAPLEHVYLEQTCLDLGTFTIRRFSL